MLGRFSGGTGGGNGFDPSESKCIRVCRALQCLGECAATQSAWLPHASRGLLQGTASVKPPAPVSTNNRIFRARPPRLRLREIKAVSAARSTTETAQRCTSDWKRGWINRACRVRTRLRTGSVTAHGAVDVSRMRVLRTGTNES